MGFLFDSFEQDSLADLNGQGWTLAPIFGGGTIDVVASALEGAQGLQWNFVPQLGVFRYVKTLSAPTGAEWSTIIQLNAPILPNGQRVQVSFTGLNGGNDNASRAWTGTAYFTSGSTGWHVRPFSVIGAAGTFGSVASFSPNNIVCKLQVRITPTSIQTIVTDMITGQFASVVRTTLSMGSIDRIALEGENFGTATNTVGVLTDYINGKIIDTPTQPLNVLATGGIGQIVLTWNAPDIVGASAVTNYNIYRSTTPGTESLLTSVGNVLTYTDNAVAPATTYYYRVAAVNAQGEGDVSYSSATTEAAVSVPDAPTLVNITPGALELTLTWNPPLNNGGSAITGYKVYRSTISGSEVLVDTIGNVTSFTDTGLIAGTEYFYKVKATNTTGDSALSNELSSTPFAAIPTTPTGLLPIPMKNYNIVIWNHVTQLTDGTPISGTDSYEVYGGNLVNEFDQVLIGTVTSQDVVGRANNIFIDLNPNATRVYRVKALASFGNTVVESLVSDKVVVIKASSQIDEKKTLLDSKIFVLGQGTLGESILV